MTTPTRPLLRRSACALAVLAALLLPLFALVGPAGAATRVVTLTNQGPSPTTLAVKVGDVVRFDNQSNVDHTVDSAATWNFHRTIAAGTALSTPAFTKAGTFNYTDNFTLVAIGQQVNGSVTVTGAPAPTASRSATPAPSRSASPRPSATRSPTASPSASASAVPTSGTGTAIGPGFGPGVLTSAVPAPSTGPAPAIAGPPPASGAPAAPIALQYGGKDALVQSSPHRYGLPAALAVVLMVGVLSLIVRLLLSLPESRAS